MNKRSKKLWKQFENERKIEMQNLQKAFEKKKEELQKFFEVPNPGRDSKDALKKEQKLSLKLVEGAAPFNNPDDIADLFNEVQGQAVHPSPI